MPTRPPRIQSRCLIRKIIAFPMLRSFSWRKVVGMFPASPYSNQFLQIVVHLRKRLTTILPEANWQKY